MQYCVEFALANGKLMMARVIQIMSDYLDGPLGALTPDDFGEMINIAHNYASYEKHFGQKVYVHRKGATSARKGELGIIPGSQGTCSYIISGKGNKDSFTYKDIDTVMKNQKDLVAVENQLTPLAVVKG